MKEGNEKEVTDRMAEHRHSLHSDVLKFSFDATVKGWDSANKAMMAINGGAAVALLAFIGGLAAQGKVALKSLSVFADCLMWFGAGVVSAALMAALAYFATYAASGSIANVIKIPQPPFFVETRLSLRWGSFGAVMRRCAWILGSLSLVFFVCGMIGVRYAILRLE